MLVIPIGMTRSERVNNERPTGKKLTTVGWDDGGKMGKKLINSNRNLCIDA